MADVNGEKGGRAKKASFYRKFLRHQIFPFLKNYCSIKVKGAYRRCTIFFLYMILFPVTETVCEANTI